MTKKISVWLTVFLVIFACAITFQLTVIFGEGFIRDQAVGEVPTEFTEATDEPADPDNSDEKTAEELLTERLVEKITSITSLYVKYFVGDINEDDLVTGVAKGLVAYSGDKYGAYHTAEEYAKLTEGYSGQFAGIGISVLYDPETVAIEIINIMPDSPAIEVGLMIDDLIIGVDGVDVAEIGYDEAINRVRGEAGTSVTLTVLRGEKQEVYEFTLERRVVEEQSVTYDTLEVDGVAAPVAYIRLMDFNDKTAEQFIAAVGQGQLDKVHGYVIDVRNNTGGELSSILDILEYLLPEGPMVRIQYKDGTEKVYESDANCVTVPMVVIANGNTASAAELFVSALADYQKAVVVGTKTYGKGTVQSLISFDDGSALRISTSMYCPPYSDNFEGVGITPDIEVDLADEYKGINLFKLDIENDAQLQAALNLYK